MILKEKLGTGSHLRVQGHVLVLTCAGCRGRGAPQGQPGLLSPRKHPLLLPAASLLNETRVILNLVVSQSRAPFLLISLHLAPCSRCLPSSRSLCLHNPCSIWKDEKSPWGLL